MSRLTKVVWREWYNASAIESMEKYGTLPRDEVELNTRFGNGESIAALIAEDATDHGSELFRDGEVTIVILEPEQFAGTYKVSVDYEPTFTAFKSDVD